MTAGAVYVQERKVMFCSGMKLYALKKMNNTFHMEDSENIRKQNSEQVLLIQFRRLNVTITHKNINVACVYVVGG